jgi:anti-sigma factor RsiW
MKHLSEQEVCDYIDGRTGESHDAAARHLAECASCSAAAALQRRIRVSASRADEGLLSKNFTDRIMRSVVSPRTAPRYSWLIENSANIFAMVFVVGVIIAIIYAVTQSTPDAGDSMYARQFSLWRDVYASAVKAISARNTDALIPVETMTHGIFNSVFVMALGALLLLGSLDKLHVFSRIFKARGSRSPV